MPATFVGEYAEQDASLRLRLWDRLQEEITKNDLQTVLDLELDLLPILIEMKMKGVRVDLEAVEKAEKDLIKERTKLLKYVKEETGMNCDIWGR